MRNAAESNKGQLLAEGLFFMMLIFSFLLAAVFFQFKAREEIQKERRAGSHSFKTKNPWIKNSAKKHIHKQVK